MNRRNVFTAAAAAGLLLLAGSGPALADNSLFGTYDFAGRATIEVASNDLPFGLGAISLRDTVKAAGSIKLQRDRLVVQLDEPIQRREVIRLDRKIRQPKRSSFRYRKSGTTKFRGNELDYKIALRLKRTAGKWSGRGRVETEVTSGELAGSSANVRGRLEQR